MRLKDSEVHHAEALLSSGVKLVFFGRKGMPFSLRVIFAGGSQLDAPGKEGTAHFLEHMLVAGTKNFPSKDKLAIFIEKYGGGFSAFTGADTVVVDVGIGDSGDLDRAIFVLGEILFNPLFEEKTIETERSSILNELNVTLANPGQKLWDVWRNLFFQSTPAARSILGTKESIGAITKDDLQDFYQQHVLAGRLVITASGGVSFNSLQEELVKMFPSSAVYAQGAIFGNLPIIREKTVAIEPYEKTDQIYALFGFRTNPAGGDETPALNIIAEVMGGGRASVLQRKLRYEQGLAYSVSTTSYKFCDSGSWVVKVSFMKPKAQKVFDIIISELRRVASNGLTEEELRFAKDKIIKSKNVEMQTSGSWVGFHSFRKFIQDSAWTVEDYCKEIEAVDSETIQKTAQKYFCPDKWYLAMCGNIQEQDIQINW